MLTALFAFLLYLSPVEAAVDNSAFVPASEAGGWYAGKACSDGTPVPPRC